MRPTPQPFPQPRTLSHVLANAEHYARYCMANSGAVTPAAFVLNPEVQEVLVPDHFATAADRDRFVTQCRLLCAALDAKACVLVMEAWAKSAKPGETLDPTEAPSEAVDREECVVLLGEDHRGPRHRFLPIIRSDNGNYFDLGKPRTERSGIEGRLRIRALSSTQRCTSRPPAPIINTTLIKLPESVHDERT